MDRRPPLPALSADLLWGRAVVLATVGLGTGTVSHLAGGGRLPGPVAMMLLLAAGVPLATLFLRRRVGRTALVLLVATGQTLTHGLLAALAGHRGDAPATGPVVLPPATPPEGSGRRSGSLYDLYAASVPTPTGAGSGHGGWWAHQLQHLSDQGPAMVVAHLAGAVVLGLFLSVGESALWALLLLVAARGDVARASGRRRLAAAQMRLGIARCAGRLRWPDVAVRTSQRRDRAVLRRRGPPVLLA
ncbi:hypothetical protein [Nocardioides houyundeii]|uniref:hypothetical protein n=1 Tax=Nocardioides houyundeii TaxID=2045452 RepID=UPI000DF2FC3A|nr:hypothetical protein [Nocardioides houyundeii]